MGGEHGFLAIGSCRPTGAVLLFSPQAAARVPRREPLDTDANRCRRVLSDSSLRPGWSTVGGWRWTTCPPEFTNAVVARGADQPNRAASRERERDAVEYSYLAVATCDIVLPDRTAAALVAAGSAVGCVPRRPKAQSARRLFPADRSERLHGAL